MQSKKNAILKTLIYSDLFDFPLKSSEVFKYLNGKGISQFELELLLLKLQKENKIGFFKDFYFLPHRKYIVELRSEREIIARKKLKIAKSTVKFLKLIPTIKLIGISGSLSVLNTKKTDDIDLFIITRTNTVWITRFFVNMILILTSQKRSINDGYGMDRICPNMFLAQDSLEIKLNKQNLFTAREIAQLRVLYNKDRTYQNFLVSNKWVNKYLPNFNIAKKQIKPILENNNFVKFINSFFYAFQFLYMSVKITNEVISPSIARFHPHDKSQAVLELFKSRCYLYLRPKKGKISLKNYSRILT